jgi:transposase
MQLTNEQWAVVEPLVAKQKLDGRGRPRVNDRHILEGIL